MSQHRLEDDPCATPSMVDDVDRNPRGSYRPGSINRAADVHEVACASHDYELVRSRTEVDDALRLDRAAAAEADLLGAHQSLAEVVRANAGVSASAGVGSRI